MKRRQFKTIWPSLQLADIICEQPLIVMMCYYISKGFIFLLCKELWLELMIVLHVYIDLADKLDKSDIQDVFVAKTKREQILTRSKRAVDAICDHSKSWSLRISADEKSTQWFQHISQYFHLSRWGSIQQQRLGMSVRSVIWQLFHLLVSFSALEAL